MGELITTMFSGVTTTITGLGTAIKDMFMNLLFEDPVAETLVLSEFAQFSFLLMGVSLALGLGYFIINKIRA